MRVPVQIEVGGRKIKVSYVKTINDNGESISAEMLAMEPWSITVAKDRHATPEQLFRTLFHELCHVAFAVSGVSATWTDDKEEPIVYALENMLSMSLMFGPGAKIKWREVKGFLDPEEEQE